MPVTETTKRAKKLAEKTKPSKVVKKDANVSAKAKKTAKKSTEVKSSKKSIRKKSTKKKSDKPKKGNYFARSYRELKKVTWPSRKESWRLTIAVIIFSAAFTGLALLVDYIFKNIIQRYI